MGPKLGKEASRKKPRALEGSSEAFSWLVGLKYYLRPSEDLCRMNSTVVAAERKSNTGCFIVMQG